MSDSNSRELLRLYQQGDSDAAADIFDRYIRRLLSLARTRIGKKLQRRIDAEDVVQSAYRSFFVHAANEEFVLERAGDLWRLLASITLHKLHGQVERHSAARQNFAREDMTDLALASAQSVHEPTPAEVIALIEQLNLVCDRLAGDQRAAFTARLQGQTVEEIATLVDKSPRTVRRLLAEVETQIERELTGVDSAGNRTKVVGARVDELSAPLRYEDYILHQLLGAGGMGKLYRGAERASGREVAIKALHKARLWDRRAIDQFVAEARILAQLHHPNIVGVEGLGRFPGGGYFIVMELIDGADLQARLSHGPLPIAGAIRIVLQVAAAMAHAHAVGIIHCDLKPANVLVHANGRTVVTDFGLAQFVEGDARSSRQAVGGTVGFMAPEIVQHGGRPTPAADVYGIGALLWTLATGSTPNRNPPTSSIDPATETIRKFSVRCLAESPGDRYPSMDDVIRELRTLQN